MEILAEVTVVEVIDGGCELVGTGASSWVFCFGCPMKVMKS